MSPLVRSRKAAWRSRIGYVALAAVAATARSGWGIGEPPTTCAHLCPGLQQTCTVTATITVVPGSVIDCGARDVQVTGGDLVVHDGRFVLKAGTITVNSGRAIVADCPQGSTNHGFTLKTSGTITIGTQSRLRADCDGAGGAITLDAGGNVTIGGLGVHANGTAVNGAGGAIRIASRGSVTTASNASATLEAKATGTNGEASGGQVEIEAAAISIGDSVVVSGVNHWANGGVVLRASGNVVVDGVVDASGVSKGDGGQITIESDHGTVTTLRPLRVRGAGAASTGGTLDVSGHGIMVAGDMIATGGTDGGGIALDARGGTIAVGTTGNPNVNIESTGGHGGAGGEIKVQSGGNDVAVRGHINAIAGSQAGSGGLIEIAGVSVTAHAGSLIEADGPPSDGGSIRVEARQTMTLSGTLHANNGMATFVYRTTPPVIGGGVTGPQTQQADASLAAPCGDDFRRDGVEQCDGSDLGVDANGADKTCQSLGYGAGTLDCLDTCLYDTSGCS